MDKKSNRKTINQNKNNLKFLIIQFILFSLLIFLIISVSLNLNFITKIDNFIFNLCDIIRNKFVNNLMLIFTFLGESITIILILIILLLFKNKKISYPVIYLTSLSAIINYILKNLVQRARPVGEFVKNLIINYKFPTSYSFPSGHSQTSIVFYFALSYFLLDNLYKGKHKKLYLTLITLIPILITISRVVLGVHYFSDVLCSVIIALIILTNYFNFKTNKIR